MLVTEPHRDPVPPLAREVIALYAEALSSVRFPDLDISVLEGMTEQLLSAELELENLERALEAAREKVKNQADLLLSRAQRALSYARVFAEGDAELSARVAEIREGEGPRKEVVPAKKRGRARKNEENSNLFDEAPSELSAEEHAA